MSWNNSHWDSPKINHHSRTCNESSCVFKREGVSCNYSVEMVPGSLTVVFGTIVLGVVILFMVSSVCAFVFTNKHNVKTHLQTSQSKLHHLTSVLFSLFLLKKR
jgi:hypothetical protein